VQATCTGSPEEPARQSSSVSRIRGITSRRSLLLENVAKDSDGSSNGRSCVTSRPTPSPVPTRSIRRGETTGEGDFGSDLDGERVRVSVVCDAKVTVDFETPFDSNVSPRPVLT
jgi:hypothetical protein